MLIDGREGVREVRRMLKEGYNVNMLSALVCEALNKHNSGGRLTKIERFYAGLRYSDFLLFEGENSETAYYMAEQKRIEYLNVLGIDRVTLNFLCEKFGGFK